jgi:hypothetical protein
MISSLTEMEFREARRSFWKKRPDYKRWPDNCLAASGEFDVWVAVWSVVK